jgi:pyruvate carboxylase
MMQGMIGWPQGGFPKVLQKIILDSAGVKPIKGRVGAKLAKVDLAVTKRDLTKKIGQAATDDDVMAYLMYPQVFLDFEKHLDAYSNTSVIPTTPFFYGLQRGEEIAIEIEPGKTLLIKFLTVSDPHDDGTRTVFYELNGQPRSVNVADKSLESSLHRHPKAEPEDPNHVGAPMPGKISTVAAKPGQQVKEGERLLSIEAMKMETAVYSPRAATVKQVLVKPGQITATNDLLIVLE